MHSKRRGASPFHILLAVIAFLLVPSVRADEGQLATRDLARGTASESRSDDWYILEIDGATAGWMHEVARTSSESMTYERTSVIRIRRGALEVEMKMLFEMHEGEDGTPLSAMTRQDMGQQQVESRMRFIGEEIEMTTRQGGQALTQKHAMPAKPWLTPLQARRYFNDRMAQGETSITFRLLDLENGLEPIEMSYERVGEEEVEVDGSAVTCTVWTVENSLAPGMKGTSKLDANGAMVIESVDLPFGRMVTRRSTMQKALAANEGQGPELMLSTFVELDAPMPLVDRAETAVLRLTVREGEMPELPSAGAQRFERGDDPRTATLHVDVANPQPADDATQDEYVRANPMVNSEDVMIAKLAQRATRKAGEAPRERAEALRSFVHDYISAKSLDTAFATASETARTRTGDCSEHGVLLCALLRAEGIPARVAVGLVYVDSFAGADNVFGWHMWTQALVDGVWLDLDATLPTRYHAGHVLTATSSLSTSSPAERMSSLLQLIGNLDIEVVDVGYVDP